MTFADRRSAGRELASAVLDLDWAEDENAIVLGIPRGGVIVAAPVADALAAHLDVAVARKIGAPHNPELAIGAVAPSGPPLLNTSLIRRLRVPEVYLDDRIRVERRELERRLVAYRGDRAPLVVAQRTAVVVDDGVATGATLVAIVEWLKREDVRRLIVAVPVGPPESIERLRRLAHDVVCLEAPRWFSSVGERYRDFGQTTDQEVIVELRRARDRDVS